MKSGEGLSMGVFERRGASTLPENVFYVMLSFWVIGGLVLTGLAAKWSIDTAVKPSLMLILGVGLAIPIIGILISAFSENWFFSAIGYLMVVVPSGIVLGPSLQQYKPDILVDAVLLTASITGIMGAAGLLIPSVFRHLGGALFMALLGLVLLRVVQIFVPAMHGWGWIEYVSAGIFSLYIGYDMHRASEIPKTMDNAVDIAVSLYLDILNLFLNILKIMGSKK